jgi:homoserine dehydrogenase
LEEIEEFYGNKEEAYFVGKISFKNLKKISTENPDNISFVLIDLC